MNNICHLKVAILQTRLVRKQAVKALSRLGVLMNTLSLYLLELSQLRLWLCLAWPEGIGLKLRMSVDWFDCCEWNQCSLFVPRLSNVLCLDQEVVPVLVDYCLLLQKAWVHVCVHAVSDCVNDADLLKAGQSLTMTRITQTFQLILLINQCFNPSLLFRIV